MSDPPLQLPRRKPDSHKGNFGRVLLIGGSRGMSGAISLSAVASLRTGSGLVSAMVPDRCLETVAGFHPGIMTIPTKDDDAGRFAIAAYEDLSARLARRNNRLSAIGCGPGMSTGSGSIAMVQRLLQATDIPRVLDADAINVLADHLTLESKQSSLVLTPHPGEFERLSGVPPKDRDAQVAAAVELANRTGVTIVLKGGPSIVIAPNSVSNATWTNTTGNPGMATAGSGDVLTGVITSLLGQGLDPWDAARLGCWIHGLAGDLAAATYTQAGMTCQELLGEIGKAVESATKSATN